MPTPPPPSLLISVDTNVPLDLADGCDDVLDALATIRHRLRQSRLLISPTAFAELVFQAESGDSPQDRQRAMRALKLLPQWQIEIASVVPVPDGVTEILADRLIHEALLPVEEYHDALVLAETGFLNCAILMTGDAHLRGMDFARASVVMKSADADMPVIATPREIVRKFFQR